MSEQAQSFTYAMRQGSDRVFASTDAKERGKLYRRGWERVSKGAAARTMGGTLNGSWPNVHFDEPEPSALRRLARGCAAS